MTQQVVKNEQQTGQVQRNSLQLGVSALCHFSDGLSDHGEDWPSTTFGQIVEKEQEQLEMFHIKVILWLDRALDGVLFQGS